MHDQGTIHGCCGTCHYQGFNDPTIENIQIFKRRIKQQRRYDDEKKGLLLTAILNENQLQGWKKTLKEAGFKLSKKWRNRSSDNLLYLFTKVTGHEYSTERVR